ncbi:hypothetical protein AB0I28_12435 [Phytomonospora sp. NPDC050363]|uniref:hypothetical protein n=1 Tax=Phytomonospora sp. NPDC050363 TaxID=3155642 RepID=UPI0034088309
MSTVKLTADMTGEYARILAEDIDGDLGRKDVFDAHRETSMFGDKEQVPSSHMFALFHVHRAMFDVASDLGGVIDLSRMDEAGVRFVLGVE